MTSQEKFEHLVAELESFLNDEQFAIEQENWGYLDELLKKKEGHLKAMEHLRAEVDTRPVTGRLQAMGKKEAACATLLQGKMNEVTQARGQLEAVRARMGKVREFALMPPSRSGGFKAEA